MATGNFYSKNASKIYAFGLSYEGEDGEIVEADEFLFDDSIDNLKYGIKERFENDTKFDYIGSVDTYIRDATPITRIDKDFSFLNSTISIQLIVIALNGYYEGANFDYELNIDVDGVDFDLDSICVDELFDILYHSSDNMGLAKIHAPNLVTKIETETELLINEVEKVLEMYSSPLVVSARFSNGETFYANAS